MLFRSAVLGEHVTTDQGTGAVHTAPGHGSDDFILGQKYGLDIYAPIGTNGRFAADLEFVGGLKVFEANPVVEATLAERGRLGAAQAQHLQRRVGQRGQPARGDEFLQAGVEL